MLKSEGKEISAVFMRRKLQDFLMYETKALLSLNPDFPVELHLYKYTLNHTGFFFRVWHSGSVGTRGPSMIRNAQLNFRPRRANHNNEELSVRMLF